MSIHEELFSKARRGDVLAVQQLLSQGANVNHTHVFCGRLATAGLTPLAIAATHGQVEVVKILLEAGADAITPVGMGRDAPLDIAVSDLFSSLSKNDPRAIIKLLLNHFIAIYDAHPENPPVNINKELHHSMQSNDAEAFAALLAYRHSTEQAFALQELHDLMRKAIEKEYANLLPLLIDELVAHSSEADILATLNLLLTQQQGQLVAQFIYKLGAINIHTQELKNFFTLNFSALPADNKFDAMSIANHIRNNKPVATPAIQLAYCNLALAAQPSTLLNLAIHSLPDAKLAVTSLQIKRDSIYLKQPELKEHDKKFTDAAELEAVAIEQIERLNHWYIWNGRKKALCIQKALNRVNAHIQQNTQDGVETNYGALASQLGLFNALEMERHSFRNPLTHQTKSKQQLLAALPQFR